MTASEDAVRPYVKPERVGEAGAQLEQYFRLLTKWNAVHNLVSRETIGDFWPRHAADSLQLLPLLGGSDRLVYDLGSGGGLPAIPLAIVSSPERRVVLFEPVTRKASFLRTVVRELGLRAEVHAERIEQNVSRETPEVVTSRALAALPLLLQLASPLFGASTRGLFHKGQEYGRELEAAAQLYDFDVILHRSVTDAAARIVEISNLRAKSAA